MEDAPELLKDTAERERRLAMLTLQHMEPLSNFVASVRAAVGAECHIPDFDPCDGGINARVLLLLEAPGPKAAGTKASSGFVSSNNPDPTAKNLWKLIHNAGIARTDTLIWNIVPWYVGENGHIKPVTNRDIKTALPRLQTLLGLLPRLEIIVLVGRKAQSAAPQIRLMTSLPVTHTYHMSAQVFNTSPEKKKQTQKDFCAIAAFLSGAEV